MQLYKWFAKEQRWLPYGQWLGTLADIRRDLGPWCKGCYCLVKRLRPAVEQKETK